MNQNLMQKLLYKSAAYLKRNSGTILTIMSTVGVVTTTVLAVKATPRAVELIKKDSRINHDGDPHAYTNMEAVRSCWKCYIPAAVTGLSTIACIVGSNVINQRTQAALTSAYALVSSSYKQYKDKLKELYGEETHNNIVDSIVKEKVKDVYISSECSFTRCSLDVEEDDNAIRLFYDEYSGKYFETTLAKVIAAEYHMNRNFNIGGYADINDWYDFLGLCHDTNFDYVGWSANVMINGGLMPWIEFNHREVALDDGLNCIVIELPIYPIANYMNDEDYA